MVGVGVVGVCCRDSTARLCTFVEGSNRRETKAVWTIVDGVKAMGGWCRCALRSLSLWYRIRRLCAFVKRLN